MGIDGPEGREQEPVIADGITALDRYYRMVVLNGDGYENKACKVESIKFKRQKRPGLPVRDHIMECIAGPGGNTCLVREAGHGVELDKYQDYGLLKVDEDNGEITVVLADGVSGGLASQSLANLGAFLLMDKTSPFRGEDLDRDDALSMFRETSGELSVSCDFNRVKGEFEEAIKTHHYAEGAKSGWAKGVIGGFTGVLLRVHGDKAEIARYGTGGIIVFKPDGRVVYQSGTMSNESGQINVRFDAGGQINMENWIEDFFLSFDKVKVEAGDIIAAFTDGVFPQIKGQIDCALILERLDMIRKQNPNLDMESLIVKYFKDIYPSDDKTMAIVMV